MISVVVPIYNTEKYLNQCVDSILNQTYRDLDVILVDDGSTDSCGLICDEYAKIDSRVRTYHIDNIGVSGARNFGINRAKEKKSQYIYFADSDDWLDSNMLDILNTEAGKHNADIAVCGVASDYLNGTSFYIQNDFVYDHILAMKSMLSGSFLNVVWNKIWKLKLFDEIEFPLGMYYEDIITTYRLFEKANIVVGVSAAVYHYRKRDSSIAHCHTIKRLNDWWYAAVKLFGLFFEGSFREDKQIQAARIRHCGTVAITVWAYMPDCPDDDLKSASLLCNRIVKFAREHFTVKNLKGLPLSIKFGAFLVRRNSRINYLLVRFSKKIFSMRQKRRLLYD